jgi:hypothetical protein
MGQMCKPVSSDLGNHDGLLWTWTEQSGSIKGVGYVHRLFRVVVLIFSTQKITYIILIIKIQSVPHREYSVLPLERPVTNCCTYTADRPHSSGHGGSTELKCSNIYKFIYTNYCTPITYIHYICSYTFRLTFTAIIMESFYIDLRQLAEEESMMMAENVSRNM